MPFENVDLLAEAVAELAALEGLEANRPSLMTERDREALMAVIAARVALAVAVERV